MKGHLINAIVECATCRSKASFDTKSRCARCRHIYYCNRDCQSADWPLHKAVCSKRDQKVPPALSSAPALLTLLHPVQQQVPAMVLPVAREMRYYGVFLPVERSEALKAIAAVLNTDDLVESIPVRGDAEAIANIRLYMSGEAKLKKETAMVNMRAEMILTEFAPTGSVIQLNVNRSITAGDVVAVKYNGTFDKLVQFNTDEFEAIWGLMAVVQKEDGLTASGGIMPKTEGNEKLLGQIIGAAAQDRADARKQLFAKK